MGSAIPCGQGPAILDVVITLTLRTHSNNEAIVRVCQSLTFVNKKALQPVSLSGWYKHSCQDILIPGIILILDGEDI